LLLFGGVLDSTDGGISARDVIERYEAVVNAPTYDVSGSDPVTQRAYEYYREAVDLFADGARDMVERARGFLAGDDPNKGNAITWQQYGPARQRTNEAAELVNHAIRWLEQQ
jgi:hypothetical protein